MEAILVTDKHSNFPVWFLPPVIGSWWPPVFYSFFFFFFSPHWASLILCITFSLIIMEVHMPCPPWMVLDTTFSNLLPGYFEDYACRIIFLFFLWTAREWECLRRTAWRWRVLLFQTSKFSRHLSGHFVAKVKNGILFLLSKSIPRMKCAVKIGSVFFV